MEKGKDLILVTGATGNQGNATARELLAGGHKVRAMTRKPESPKAKELAALGAEVVRADLDDQSSLEGALNGAWGAYAVQNTWEAGAAHEEEQGLRFADAAHKAGVRHLVYASVASAHRATGIPHFENKWRIENRIRSLGFPSWTVIRPVFFMENWASPWFKPGIDQGTLMVAMKPDTPLQMIAVRDIGRYGAMAFDRHEELNARAIDIAGDSLTMPQTAEAIGRAAGKPVSFVPLSIEEVRKANPDFASMLEWFDAVGYDADIAGNAAKYRIRPTPFEEWARGVAW